MPRSNKHHSSSTNHSGAAAAVVAAATTNNKNKKKQSTTILLCDSGGHRLGLDIDGVERLVKTLLNVCTDSAVADQYKRRYNRRSINYKNILATPNDKMELVTALRHLLSCADKLPGTLIAQAHHTIGIIHQRTNNAEAKNAFLQALWIQSSCPGISPTDLGLTKVGLALEYGRIGHYHEAIPTLEAAVIDFQKGGLAEDHEAWTLVSNAMSTFQLASEKNRILAMKESRGRKKNLLTRPLAVVGLPAVKEEKGGTRMPTSTTTTAATVAKRSKTPPMLIRRPTRSKTPPMATTRRV